MITSRRDLVRYMAADLAAHRFGRFRRHYVLTHPTVYFQRLLRLAEYYDNCRTDPVGRLWAAVLKVRLAALSQRLGLHIPRNVFGAGLVIAHPGTIVVSHLAQVGSDCDIYQGVTIGAAWGVAPVIGCRVFIGPGAVVSGALTVGDGAGIAANSVVTHDVPPGVLVAGAPARIIDTNPAGLVTRARWAESGA